MNFIYYPDEASVRAVLGTEEPLLLLVSYDGETAIVSHIDEAMEHHILLAKVAPQTNGQYKETDIDRFFRAVVDNTGADWTFVCPRDYQGITDQTHRLTTFYKDGCRCLSEALAALGYVVDINIPKRYRRHFDLMSGNA